LVGDAAKVRFPPEIAKSSLVLSAVDSIDRCNTLSELLRWGLILQGLAWPFIQLTGNCAQFCLGMGRQVGATNVSSEPFFLVFSIATTVRFGG